MVKLCYIFLSFETIDLTNENQNIQDRKYFFSLQRRGDVMVLAKYCISYVCVICEQLFDI